MSKTLMTVRIGETQLEALEHIAKERGLNLGQLVRGWLDNQMAESDVDIALEVLYELRGRIDQRIAEKEAERIAEIKNRKPPDLVIAESDGVHFTIERAEAVKAGFSFRERKTSKQ